MYFLNYFKPGINHIICSFNCLYFLLCSSLILAYYQGLFIKEHTQSRRYRSSKMCAGAYKGRGVNGHAHLCTNTLSLFMFLAACLYYCVLCYMQKFNLTFQIICICHKLSRSVFCHHEISFFYSKIFFVKPSQPTFANRI